MSFSSGAFPVLIKWPNGLLCFMTFPNRSTADEYWRRCQQSSQGKVTLCRRFQPQYFNISISDHDINSQGQEIAARSPLQWLGSNGPAVLQHQEHPDNVNGGTFYIRSVIQPDLFWCYLPSTKTVIISNVLKTKFLICRKEPLPFNCPPEEDILISEDDINIYVPTPEWDESGSPDEMIVKGPCNKLVAASTLSADNSGDTRPEQVMEAGVFKFGMFDGGFGAWEGNSSLANRVVFASSRVNGGERWEFVR